MKRTAEETSRAAAETHRTNELRYLTAERLADLRPIWINPVGGKGDILLLSTALKRVYDKTGRKFRVMRRTDYTPFLQNHPAVELIGHPTEEDEIICNDYWSREEFADPRNKALAIVCKIFGTDWEGNDELYLPEQEESAATKAIIENTPWTDKTVVISISSASPRKMLHPMKWHELVMRLNEEGCNVIQIGEPRDVVIKGVYSLVGCTLPLQIPAILTRASAVVTLDNFVMHAARAVGVPTVALFGPTESSRYGYPSHRNIQANTEECPERDHCLGPHVSQNYCMPCTLGPDRHCMNTIPVNAIVDLVMSIMK